MLGQFGRHLLSRRRWQGTGRVLPGADVLTLLITVVRNDFAQQYPDVTRDILNVFAREQDWVVRNEDGAKQIVAEDLDLPIEIVDRAWPKHDFKPRVGESEVDYLQAIADFLYSDLGFIENEVDVRRDVLDL